MNIIHTKKFTKKIILYQQQHHWIWLYLMSLLVLIIFGNLSARFLPLVDLNNQLPGDLTYEGVSPGWASNGVVRSFLEPWLRWDATWYLLIAKQGYSSFGTELAYPPVYPFLIRIIGKLFGNQFLLASLIISWTAVFGACLLLEERFTHLTDQQTAVRGIRNLLIFPTAFFFFAGYTEGLFLLLLLLAWRYAEREKWLLAGLFGAVATLTRFLGIILIIPFMYMWMKKNWRKKKIINLSALLLIPFAYFGWGILASKIFQITPATALNKGWALHFDMPWVGVVGSLKLIFSQPIAKSYFAYIDLFAVIITIFCLYYLLRKKLFAEVFFVAGFTLIALLKISDLRILGSTSRYILPLFPLYLMLAEWGQHKKIDRLILVIMLFLWLLSAAMFFTWNWVA